MKGERFARMHCSVARAAAVTADRWTVLILRDLFLGLNRYEDLRADLGIATNILADRLEHLTAEGVVGGGGGGGRPPPPPRGPRPPRRGAR
ncbi:winged helix-turn-helix transcriptional regulator, partial [Streptomyces sp. NPDC058257]|uniref:winged helix-turn-helix transcriptional regulator n=1 Tax=Streptomyces sp. NPDC058257 TaxID=3346409 RepID=UPI0036EB508B